MNELPQRFHNGDEVTIPDVLPGFAVPLVRFFEQPGRAGGRRSGSGIMSTNGGGEPVSTAAAAAAPTAKTLITAEEFLARYAHRYAELIDGELVEEGMPSLRHAQVCSKTNRLIGNFVEQHQLGQTFTNDPHILIHRNPDRMRGPDVCFFTFATLPPGPAPDGVSELVPELTVEVRSPSNTWTQIFGKIGDYLQVGVKAVLVLDPDGLTASVYRADTGQQIFHTGDELTLPDVLPGFAVPVTRFFE